MDVLLIIGGIVLLLAAAIAVVVAFADETVIAIGVAVVVGVLGGWSLHHGWHGEHAKFHAKHQAILHDLTKQGFHVKTDAVFAVGGNFLSGTEVDLNEGGCQFIFIARKIDGVWHAVLPRYTGGGVKVFTSADADALAAGCP